MSCRSTKPTRQSLSILTSAPPYNSKAFSELHLNRLADAEATVRRATERKLEFH